MPSKHGHLSKKAMAPKHAQLPRKKALASKGSHLPNSDDDGMPLSLEISRGDAGQKRDFKPNDRKVKSGRITKRVSDREDGPRWVRVLEDGTEAPLWYTGLFDSTIQGKFRIPKYEAWHKADPSRNPYNHFFFPMLEDGELRFEMRHCNTWSQVEGNALQMKYNTEHVFEVQQLKSFFGELIMGDWICGNNELVDILFDPNSNPVTSWPFYGSEATSMAQLLADCLPNHSSGTLDHDFVYLEARVNQVKGKYFYNVTPKALSGSASTVPSGLTELKELWSALATTVLVFEYLNNEIVVRKYNHVSRRIRKMLHEIARQSGEDRLPQQQSESWSSWNHVVGKKRLVEDFSTWETGFLRRVERTMQRAFKVGISRLLHFQPKNVKETVFHQCCLQKLQSQRFAQTPHFLPGIALYNPDNTRRERENCEAEGSAELREHVSHAELGEIDVVTAEDCTDRADKEESDGDNGEGLNELEWAEKRRQDEEIYSDLVLGTTGPNFVSDIVEKCVRLVKEGDFDLSKRFER
ncbi:hypothetical protein H2198_005649 [Neophaeococcomyces mojaviensis]|uniref:Uncharacterized protein n=1 Tax=Neophaeococcomyces mojaviensis TaxID=3383035 RepID=A0ACC3A5H4_9EURO|nr:hypothetical protein H2198_005649 [Knufia sp. JES_112]